MWATGRASSWRALTVIILLEKILERLAWAWEHDVMGVYIVDYEGNKPGTLKVNGNRGDNVRHTFDEPNYTDMASIAPSERIP